MNIDLEKWAAEYADGFDYTPGIGLTYKGDDYIGEDRASLFLQRAIEGVEKSLTESGKLPYHDIEIQYIYAKTGKWYWRFDNPKPNGPCDTPDQAKEKALMYVREQKK